MLREFLAALGGDLLSIGWTLFAAFIWIQPFYLLSPISTPQADGFLDSIRTSILVLMVAGSLILSASLLLYLFHNPRIPRDA